jgi:type IV pilus assembly protein PilY1
VNTCPRSTKGLPRRALLAASALAAMLATGAPAQAAVTDLTDEPIATQSSTSTAPNVMFILDDSGSMDWDYMPGSGTAADPSLITNTSGSYGYKSSQCNGLAYDPKQTYTPPVKWNGVSYPDASYTGVWTDGYTPRFTGNTAYALNNTALTHSLGSKSMTFSYSTGILVSLLNLVTSTVNLLVDTGLTSVDQSLPTWATGTKVVLLDQSDSAFWMVGTATKGAFSSPGFLACLIACTQTQTYTVNVTFFTGKDNASNSDWYINTPATTNLGTSTYYDYTGTQAAMGWTYNAAGSTDATTTYARECISKIGLAPGLTKFTAQTVTTSSAAADQLNYANWYQYQRTRLMLMKSASGKAFLGMPATYRVGVTKISHSQYSSANANFFLGVNPFTEDATVTTQGQKFNFYVHLYNSKFFDRDASTVFNGQRSTSFGTPLRLSLAQVGKYYAGKLSGATEPMTAACQRNYAILSTDGYWNDTTTPTGLTGAAIGNQDASPEVRPMLDGLSKSNTLADVAQYFYATDLRDPALSNCGTASLCTNDTTATTDIGTIGRQNMVTYTVGLGVGGTLSYDKSYASQTSGDFASIKSGTKNWPDPTVLENATRVDDLWHTAVNGRGRYFSAQNAKDLTTSLETTINNLVQTAGSGNAISSSAFQLSASDTNYTFKGSYVTSKWIGELEAFAVSADATIATMATWAAQDQLDTLANRNSRIAPASGVTSPQCGSLYSNCNDERVIYFMHPTTKARTAFTYPDLLAAGLDADAKFTSSCGTTPKLSQCTGLSTAQKALVNTGKNFVNYLRGDATYENTNTTNPLFRSRDAALGDIAGGSPAYAGKPPFQYTDTGYSDYVTAQTSRTKMVYVPANDGMLHAFYALTGKEAWAFVPNTVMPNLYKLADKSYTHQYFVDGSPVIADIKVGGVWKTILIGGLNKGGKAYYALDVTDPTTPIPLWEYTHANLGYTYGNPVITKNSAGTWVVAFTSGYNNTATGLGYLYVLDAYSGLPMAGSPMATTAGTATTPSGLAPLNAWVDSSKDNTAKRLYAGDLLGNLWRFDINTAVVAPVAKFVVSSVGQPITVKPESGSVTYNGTTYPVVLVGTGRYLHSNDVSNTALQSVYAVRDKLDDTGWGDVRAGGLLVSKSFTSAGSGTDLTRTATSSTKVDWSSKSGWVLDLRPSSTTLEGERVVTNMAVAYSTLVVGANIPSAAASCTAAGGTSWLYYLSLADGYTDVAPMYQGNTMISGISVIYDSAGKAIVITNRSDGTTKKQTNSPASPAASTGGIRRVSWRELVN